MSSVSLAVCSESVRIIVCTGFDHVAGQYDFKKRCGDALLQVFHFKTF